MELLGDIYDNSVSVWASCLQIKMKQMPTYDHVLQYRFCRIHNCRNYILYGQKDYFENIFFYADAEEREGSYYNSFSSQCEMVDLIWDDKFQSSWGHLLVVWLKVFTATPQHSFFLSLPNKVRNIKTRLRQHYLQLLRY